MKNLPTKRDQQSKNIVFLPMPGISHLTAMVELIKHLLHHNPNFNITILTFSYPNPSPLFTSYISSITTSIPNISFHYLPTMPTPTITSPFTLFDLHMPNIISALATLKTVSSVSVVVIDFFAIDVLSSLRELSMLCYVCFTCSAAMLGHMLWFPVLDETLPPSNMEGLNLDGIHVHIPTVSSPVPSLALHSSFADRKGEKYLRFVDIGRRFRETDGIIVNSYQDLEPYATKALLDGKCVPDGVTPPLYFVGSLLNVIGKDSEVECVKWLDRQPDRSVVFLCFGSMGGFSKEQAREIAVGLERSGWRFLWVLRSASPSKGLPVDADLDDVLPDGFLERTKDRGMVWPTYAPQAQILAHKSIGGFVTHCGWNSYLESIWFGVPTLAWPLYAEQHFNAFCMVQDVGVSIKLNIDVLHGNWATAKEVERGVRCLMEEGGKVSSKVLEFKEKGRRALEEGGSSYLSVRSLVEALTKG